MGAFRTCFLFISLQLVSMIASQELYKRLPQGFVGMRGKKYIDDSAEQFYKRKPQFFVGVKGKKTFYDFMESPENYFKRAPMGFMGVRGKKEALIPENNYYPQNYEYVLKRDGSLIGQIDYTSNENTNDPEFPILNEILNEYLQKLERPAEAEVNDTSEETERITNEVDKRAANIHQFFGVRGKKSIQNKRPYDLSFRGKFIGVRGKKDLKNSPQEIKFLLSGPFPKRKGQMGFFGMRGKKWIDESSPEVETPN
ncbi:tachykinins [Manduca sexta]|uniref:Tachykinin n=1 Tax=Manduca sexta TaxID=7130 RepID=A0A922CFI8_MANSE|nr:tachykinins [Manduca sexta]KAG6443522.1 hypothetical protein O3G_MSEX002928 [Manduca sexta]KAG6443523.1 hypothetical protein O3G_MSEX002928 [Manduca sexta]